MTFTPDPKAYMLRHAVATLAYRGAKVLREAPPSFAHFKAAPTTRTPAQILAHIGDLLDWGLGLANGTRQWRDSVPLPWDEEVARFFAALEAFDQRLATNSPLGFPEEKLFQGPIADALTHIGQMAMLRRMDGRPVRGESYLDAEITVGRVGSGQSPPSREFD